MYTIGYDRLFFGGTTVADSMLELMREMLCRSPFGGAQPSLPGGLPCFAKQYDHRCQRLWLLAHPWGTGECSKNSEVILLGRSRGVIWFFGLQNLVVCKRVTKVLQLIIDINEVPSIVFWTIDVPIASYFFHIMQIDMIDAKGISLIWSLVSLFLVGHCRM